MFKKQKPTPDIKTYAAEQLEGNEVRGGYCNAYNNIAMKRADIVSKFCDPNKVTSILDVGCRRGYALEKFVENFPDARVVGVDIVPEFVEEAKEIAEVHLADAHELPFADNEFNLTFCSHTLEHCHDLPKAIDELVRVTSDILYIVVPLEHHNETIKNCSHYYGTMEPLDWLNLLHREKFLLHSCELSMYSELLVLYGRRSKVKYGKAPEESEDE